MRILVIDNYDSFTYNLVHYIEELSSNKVTVARNDEITVTEASQYDKILLSPGPGVPDESGIMKELIEKLSPTKSIIGICLGMQAIAEVFGGKLVNLESTFHGVATDVFIEDIREPLFKGIPLSFKAGRYHSWVADAGTLPSSLHITATDSRKMIMALRHNQYDVCGVQFHPESVLTEFGKQIIANWLDVNSADFTMPVLPTSNGTHYNMPDALSNLLCC